MWPFEGDASLDGQSDARGQIPIMHHWNVPHPHVSLRDIIKEEQALQENVKMVTQTPTGASDFSILAHVNILNDVPLWFSHPHLFPTALLSDQAEPRRPRPAGWSRPVERGPAVCPLPHHWQTFPPGHLQRPQVRKRLESGLELFDREHFIII